MTARADFTSRADGSGHFRLRDTAGDDISLHELMHRMQQVLPALDKLFQDVHKRRTAGETLSGVSGPEYPNELGRKDGYVTPYQGREYRIANVNGSALEVMTVAFEYVLGGNAKKRKAIGDADQEMLDLVLAVLWYF